MIICVGFLYLNMNDFKPILSIETSSDLCGAALLVSPENYFSYEIKKKNIHSEKLIPMIQSLLESAGIKINDLSHIAVSIGPGSFTGLRIGLSAAKGLAFGAGIGICPVPTFEAFALMICRFVPENTNFVIARKVNIDELYCARFVKHRDIYKIVNSLEIIKKDNFNNYITPDDLIFGNYNDREKDVPADTDAISVAKWSYLYGLNLITLDYDFLEPNYIKKFEGRK